MFGGGHGGSEGLRSRVARGRPNWWVILAVSLGLIAVLVATAGGTPSAPRRAGGSASAVANLMPSSAGAARHDHTRPVATTTTTSSSSGASTTSTSIPASPSAQVTVSHPTSGTTGAALPSPASSPPATTTTAAPTTTTTAAQAQAADRTVTQGYLSPPNTSSDRYQFTGTGSMQVSVVWSGNTYLTLQVTCPTGNQSVGGAAAMEATLPDADGSCLATVTEPSNESTALTYTISIGPTGG